MATGRDLVNVALKEVGYREGANNYNKYGASFGDPNNAWCGYFVSWCLKQIGIDDYGGTGASWMFALDARDRGIGTYHAKGSGYSPKMGDLFIEDFDGGHADHVGIVKEDASGGHFDSVDGNSGNAVSVNYGRSVSGFCYVNTPYYCETMESIAESLNLETWDDVVTVEDLNKAFEGGGLAGQGQLFWEICIAYQVNPAFAAAIACHESTDTTYQPAIEAHNYFGYMVGPQSSVFKHFDSLEEGLTAGISNISRNYLHIGLNYRQIQQKYCPVGASNDPNGLNNYWYEGVRTKYRNITGDDVVSANLGSGVADDNEGQSNLQKIREGKLTSGSSETSEKKPITTTATMSYVGEQAGIRNNIFDGLRMKNQSNIELYIANPDGRIYKPVICDKIEWEPPKNSYAMLGFTVLKDPVLDFQEGAQTIFKYRGENVFCGYVFEKSRSDSYRIKVTAYDQLRYFNNKDIYVYQDITASELLTAICKDHSVKLGGVYDTGIKLPLTVEDNIPLIDIMYNALEYTVSQGGIYCVLYDDFGQVRLDPQYWFRVPYAVNKETVQSIDYTSSINEGTFNRIKTYRDNEETGVREVYINDKSAEFSQWGVLQYTHQLEDGQDGAALAENLIKITTNKTRSLSVKGAFGDIRVRGGSSVFVDLDLGDLLQYGYMEVSGAKHTFTDSSHTMDLDLIGGQFI